MSPSNPYVALRERLGWSQERLAQELGISRWTVIRRETGKLPLTKIEALALEALEARAKLAEDL